MPGQMVLSRYNAICNSNTTLKVYQGILDDLVERHTRKSTFLSIF